MPLATKLYSDGDEAAFLEANKRAKCKLWAANILYYACTLTFIVLFVLRKITLGLLIINISNVLMIVVLLASLLRIKSLITTENKNGLFKPSNKIAWLTIIVYFITLVGDVVITVLLIKLLQTEQELKALNPIQEIRALIRL